jgi:SAM-dependent methyltransferase
MNFKGIDICCPLCRGELDRPSENEWVCRSCSRRFPVLLEIPDLRVFADPYASFEVERAKVKMLAERFNDLDLEGFIDFYYANASKVPAHHAALYKRSLMAGVARARAWLGAWEEAGSTDLAMQLEGHALVEVGCGTAPLLVAAEKYSPRAGVDIALRWLVVAKKRLQEAGLDLPLICACAEALPFPPKTFNCAVADSALEHFTDQPKALDQILRVLKDNGRLFVATPNRFSLGPDPQTGIWAGSLLPESWTAAMVRRQGGVPPKRHLLSAGGLERRLIGAGFQEIRVYPPAIAAEQRAHFSPALRACIALYDLARQLPGLRALLRLIGPLLHAVATRRIPKTQSENLDRMVLKRE